MRRVVLSMSMSLDGCVASDRQHPGALPEDDELVQWRIDWISGAGAHLMGRTTYQEMSSFWPQSPHPYAAPMNDIRRWCSRDAQRQRRTFPAPRRPCDLATEIAASRMTLPDSSPGRRDVRGGACASDLIVITAWRSTGGGGSVQRCSGQLPARCTSTGRSEILSRASRGHIYTPQQGRRRLGACRRVRRTREGPCPRSHHRRRRMFRCHHGAMPVTG